MTAGQSTAFTRRRWLECRVPPPLVVAVMAAGMWGVARLMRGDWPAWTAQAGLALGLSGVLVAGWAVMSFRRASTTIHPLRPSEASALVVAGPNRWSRNPMYVGMLMALTGWGLWVGGGLALSGAAGAWAWLHWLQVLPEERAMTARFGAEYADYCARVRRWV